MKFTVIVPTMWRFDLFPRFLDDLVDVDYIDQIIIINNDNTKTPNLPTSDKITLIDLNQNLKVNPSWNLAVRLSRNEDICIVNDDIIYDLRVYKHLTKIDPNNFGAAGMVIGGPEVGQPQKKTGIIDINLLEHTYFGFGQLMYVKKSKWLNIPYELNFGFGDDWTVHSNIARKLLVYNIYECMTMTEGYTTMREVKDKLNIYEQEKQTYNEYITTFYNTNEQTLADIQMSLQSSVPSNLKSLYDLLEINDNTVLIGENLNVIAKLCLAKLDNFRVFDLGFDAEVQKLLIQMSKFKKFNYERLFSDATDILDIDTLIVYGNVDITKIERNINKRIIILNPKELKFNDFAGWKLNSIYNDFIILQRVN